MSEPLQIWIRENGRVLRSRSLFTQPSNHRVENLVQATQLATRVEDEERGFPAAFGSGILFFDNGIAWQGIPTSVSSPIQEEPIPTRLEKGNKNLSSNSLNSEWDSDADFFYLSPAGTTVWFRTPLVNSEPLLFMDGQIIGAVEEECYLPATESRQIG